MVASLVGGAILLFSCSGGKGTKEVNMQTMITQQSDSLTMVYTKNGVKEYRFWTPLMERYEFARDPYMEFRYGINIVTFDSLGRDNSKMRADYAIFYEKRELWETRGNVVGESADGRKLYTQQLFWDQKTDRVYSNVDCRIVDGADEFVGEGFESDGDFKDWLFRESEGRMWVDASQSDNPEPEEGAEGVSGEQQRVENTPAPTENPRSYLDEQEEKMRKSQEKRENPRSKAERAKEQNKERSESVKAHKERAKEAAQSAAEHKGEPAKERNLELNKAGKGFDKERFARPMGEGGTKPLMSETPAEL